MSERKERELAITLLGTENETIESIRKKAKSLINTIRYKAKKKGWTVEIVLIGSEHRSVCSFKNIEHTKKPGRPKKYFFEPSNLNCKCIPHLHFILKSNPGMATSIFIKNYWKKRNGGKMFRAKKAYDRDGYLAYMDMQSSFEMKLVIK
jgi:hypothetical protein